jgi:RNAse (barnase) inhibitor barstar
MNNVDPIKSCPPFIITETTYYAFVSGDQVHDFLGLYEQLRISLKIPGYFGYNLDALYDILCDLSWIDQDEITIIYLNYFSILNEEVITLFKEIVVEANKEQINNKIIKLDFELTA